MISGDVPKFLKIDSLPRTLCLELIESVLSNHYNLFFKVKDLFSRDSRHSYPMLASRTTNMLAGDFVPDVDQNLFGQERLPHSCAYP
jgi:hypothetical protein